VAEELRKQNGAWQVCRFRHPEETFIHWLENECTSKNFPLPYSLFRNIFLWTFKICVLRFNQRTYTHRWVCWMARKVSRLVPRNLIWIIQGVSKKPESGKNRKRLLGRVFWGAVRYWPILKHGGGSRFLTWVSVSSSVSI